MARRRVVIDVGEVEPRKRKTEPSVQARFVPKVFEAASRGKPAVWGVYDVLLGSWPRERPGIGQIAQETDEKTAVAEAARLGEYFGPTFTKGKP